MNASSNIVDNMTLSGLAIWEDNRSLSPYLKLKLMSTFTFDSYEIHSDLNLKCPTFKELHLFEIPRFEVESEQRNLGSASIEPIIGLRMTPSIAEVAEKLVRK